MPRLADSRSGLIAALDDRYGRIPIARAAQDSPLTLFEELAQMALGLVAPPAVAVRAFQTLKDAGLLEPEQLATANPLEIDDALKHDQISMAIRSLRPLQKLARWSNSLEGNLSREALSRVSTATIREEWAAINGIGSATADRLLLSVLNRPSYPVDRATYRILVRHGWLDSTAESAEARDLVEKFAGDVDRPHPQGAAMADTYDEAGTTQLLEQLSEWFARVGHEYCKPSRVHCDQCPLRPWLPSNGPVEVD